MLHTSVEYYKNAEVCRITIGNRKLFWVRMKDVKKGLGIKNMSDLVRSGKKIDGFG